MRSNMQNDNIRNSFIIGSVCVVILLTALITYLMYSNKQDEGIQVEDFSSVNENTNNIEENTESASSTMGKTVEESENELVSNTSTEKNTTTKSNTTKNTSTKAVKEEKDNTKNETETEKDEEEEKEEVEPKFEAPVKGEIIREFASESLVYSNTLQEWITHNGIDIKADKTSVVAAAAEGTVYVIKNDPRYGLTVIINHDAGYQTIYSNLLTAEFVVEGEKVEAGQTIGTVGNTASFEISDDYHLHFEVLKNNQCIDPTTCINF